jgi:hypothetical protein
LSAIPSSRVRDFLILEEFFVLLLATPKRSLTAGIVAKLARPWRGREIDPLPVAPVPREPLLERLVVAPAKPHSAFNWLAAVLAARHSRDLLSDMALGLAFSGEPAALLAPLLGLAVVTGAIDQRRSARAQASAADLAAAHHIDQKIAH